MLIVIVGCFCLLSNICQLSMINLTTCISHDQSHKTKHQHWLVVLKVVKDTSTNFSYFMPSSE